MYFVGAQPGKSFPRKTQKPKPMYFVEAQIDVIPKRTQVRSEQKVFKIYLKKCIGETVLERRFNNRLLRKIPKPKRSVAYCV